jgi:arginine transport system substrate-binding protein
MKKYMILSFVFTILVGFFFYFKKDVLIKDEPIVIGMMSGWPPYMNINKQGEFEGFDVDIAQELEKKIGKKVEVRDLGSLESLVISLDKGKIDVLMSGLGITEKRLKMMEMVLYVEKKLDQCYLMFWGDPPVKKIEELKENKNNIVCYEPGSELTSFINWPEYDYLRTRPIPEISTMILDIKYGKSNAMILQSDMGIDAMKKYPEIKGILVPIPEKLKIPGLGICVKKGNFVLKNVIEKGIDALKNDGTIERLQEKWSRLKRN